MRGGDGLSRAAQYAFYTEGTTVTAPYFHTCTVELELEGGTLKLKERADYPVSGTVSFTVFENTVGALTLKLFATTAWTSGADSKVLVNGTEIQTSFDNGFVVAIADLKAGDELVFDTQIKFHTFDNHECVNNSKDHFSFRHGPLMLGVKSVLNGEENDAAEIKIARDAECKAIGVDATKSRDIFYSRCGARKT